MQFVVCGYIFKYNYLSNEGAERVQRSFVAFENRIRITSYVRNQSEFCRQLAALRVMRAIDGRSIDSLRCCARVLERD